MIFLVVIALKTWSYFNSLLERTQTKIDIVSNCSSVVYFVDIRPGHILPTVSMNEFVCFVKILRNVARELTHATPLP